MTNTDVMTKYEIISTIISSLALALSILIPIIQWLWRRFIISADLEFHANGQAILFFNQSGSYIRLFGVIESKRKSTTVRKMWIDITRTSDNNRLSLVWSSLISPVNQNLVGNFVQTTEVAHPFRVEADSVMCAFVEYGDMVDSFRKKFFENCPEWNEVIPQFDRLKGDYERLLSIYSESPEYAEAKKLFQQEFFWNPGRYLACIIIEYDKGIKKQFPFVFDVSEQTSEELRNNIDEIMRAKLKAYFHQALDIKAPTVELLESNIQISKTRRYFGYI